MLTLCQWYCVHAGVQLSAEWLSRGQQSALVQQLDSLWREQGLGGPICFSWMDWLQNDALPFLGINERLLLTFMPHDSTLAHSFHDRTAAEAPRLLLPAQREQLDSRALAHGKAAAGIVQTERQASQQLAGPANASRAGSNHLQSSQTNGVSHHAPDRQHIQHQHSQNSGSLTGGQAPQRDCKGRQTADDRAAERSSSGQLGTCKHRNRSQSHHGVPLNPKAHAWQPRDEPGQRPGRVQAEQSQDEAAVPSGEQISHPEQAASAAGTAKLEGPAPATGMADADQPLPASSHPGELAKPVSGIGTQGEHLESMRPGSTASKSARSLDPSSDMEQIAKLFTRLAAYSKMRDRELFREVRRYQCLRESVKLAIVLLQLSTSKSTSILDMRARNMLGLS